MNQEIHNYQKYFLLIYKVHQVFQHIRNNNLYLIYINKRNTYKNLFDIYIYINI